MGPSQGRAVLWGYMKELRSVPAPPCLCNKFSYAGCLSLPRVLYLKGDRLFQASERAGGPGTRGCCGSRTDTVLPAPSEGRGPARPQAPLPELTALRSDAAVHVSRVALRPQQPWALVGLRGQQLDVELAVRCGRGRGGQRCPAAR